MKFNNSPDIASAIGCIILPKLNPILRTLPLYSSGISFCMKYIKGISICAIINPKKNIIMQYVVTYTKLFTTIDLNKTGIPETIIKIANIKLIFSIDKNKNNNQLSFH